MSHNDLKLREIFDLKKLDSLFSNFAKATNLAIGILEYPSHEIIFMHGSADVCNKFHWTSPKTAEICRMSHIENSSKFVMPGNNYVGNCPNGLAHGCTPININGKHVATIFLGQMLFEEPDLNKFEEQAKRFNFNVDEYLTAIKKLPVMKKSQFQAHLNYISELAVMITEMGNTNLKAILKNKTIELQEQNLQNEITSRKQVEEILKDTQTKFLAISEAAKDAIILINSNGITTYCNPAVEKVFGYNCNEVLGKNIHNLIAPKNYHKESKNKFEHFAKTGEGDALGKTLELPASKKDGTQITIELSVSPLKLNNQWNAIGIIRDVTERKNLENELEKERSSLKDTIEERTRELKFSLLKLEDTNLFLEESNTYKTRFLQSISHELRTPLNAIIGFTQLLSQQIFGELNKTQSDYVQLITENGNSLLLMIDNILNITQIDAGSFDLKEDSINLDDFIKEMSIIVDQKFKAKNIEFKYTIKTPNIIITADKLKLRQIMYNLLSNACKYTQNSDKVEVVLEKTDNEVKISIIDTGKGIQPENICKIFDCFFKENTENGKLNQGAGIGLTLAKRLVEMHNGSINVKSEPGKGSEFWFTLPFKN